MDHEIHVSPGLVENWPSLCGRVAQLRLESRHHFIFYCRQFFLAKVRPIIPAPPILQDRIALHRRDRPPVPPACEKVEAFKFVGFRGLVAGKSLRCTPVTFECALVKQTKGCLLLSDPPRTENRVDLNIEVSAKNLNLSIL